MSHPLEGENITPYITDAETVFIKTRQKPLCDVPRIRRGNQPTDGGNLIFDEQERDELLKHEPQASKFIKRFRGSEDFINNIKRYCLWLVDIKPEELRDMPRILKRVEACKKYREKGGTDSLKLVNAPHLFREKLNPDNYIAIPETSSETREYIPIGWLNSEVIPSNALRFITGANLYHFGVLTSRVHMAWMRAVAGRFGIGYRYSNTVVYNNFPWPSPSNKQCVKIENAAQKILDARALYPESSFSSLYDDVTMPVELRKAHRLNDAAVCEAYKFDKDISEADIVAELVKLYKEILDKS